MRQREGRKGKRQTESENERQVGHLVRVKDGRHEEEKAEREWQ